MEFKIFMSKITTALKFNVSKKLSQLNKVISIFSYQISDRKYQIDQLNKKYNPEIKKVLDKCWEARKECAESIEKEIPQIVDKIKGEYEDKGDQLLKEYHSFIRKIEISTTGCIEKNQKEKETLMNLMKHLTTSNASKNEAFLKTITEAEAQMKEKIKTMRTNFRAEKETITQDLKNRSSQLTEGSLQRIAKIKSEAQLEIDTLKSQMNFNTKLDLNLLRSYSSKISDLKHLISDLRKKVTDLQLKDEIIIDSNRHKFSDLVKEIIVIKNEMDHENGKIDQMISTDDIIELESQKQEQNSRLNREIDTIRNAFDEMKSKFKEELDNKRKKLKLNKNSLNSQFVEIEKQNQSEIDALIKQVSDKEKLLMQKNNAFEKKIKIAKKEIKKDEKQTKSEFAALLEKYEKEMQLIQGELEKQRLSLIEENKNIQDQVQKEIDDKISGGNSEIIKSKQELDSLENEKCDIFDRNNKSLLEYDSETNEKVMSLQQEYANNSTQNDLESDLIEFQNEETKKIEAIKQVHQEQAQLAKENRNNEVDQSLKTQIEETNWSNEVEDLISKFKSEYEERQKELNSIQPPKLDNSNAYSELEQLKQDKQSHFNKATKERGEIETKWERIINEENERHNNTIKKSTSGRGREQVRQSIQQQIEDTKNAAEAERKRIQGELESIIASFKLKLAELNELKKEAEDQTEVNKLKQKLEQDSHTKEIESALNKKTENLNNKLNDIERAKSEISKKIELKKQEMDSSNEQFESDKAELLSELQHTKEKYQREVDTVHNESENNLHTIANDHIKEFQRLQMEIDQMRKNIEDSLVNQEKQREETSRRLNAKIENYVHDQKKRYEETKTNWQGMIDYFNERIAVLKKNLEDSMNSFENRPSRECDIARINELESTFTIVKMQLSNNLKDMAQYKTMLIEQEKSLNAKFGKNPHIGVLTFNSQ